VKRVADFASRKDSSIGGTAIVKFGHIVALSTWIVVDQDIYT
jgi:hypothetical protein